MSSKLCFALFLTGGFCMNSGVGFGEGTTVTAITTTQAPTPIGPYSQGILATPGEMLFISGQIPLNPATGEIITDITAATTQVMEYIKAILNQAGMDFSNIVKTTIYLLDLKNFAQVNEVYASYFTASTNFPARETVAVAGLPKGASVEISVVAIR